MVYSAALRKTGNPAAAEEITQAVYIILAKKSDKLSRHDALSGWLYQTTRLTAANFLRTEIRRVRREQEAYMQSLSNETESEVWPRMMPLLEDGMGRLGEKDRNALALRFFEGKSFQEIGVAFGASENAAKKRVAYALEKLRTYFAKHGVTSTTGTIAGAISANSVQAAPVTLAKTATAVALAKDALASTSTLTLIKGTLKMMVWTKARTAIVTATVVLFTMGTATMTVSEIQAHRMLKIRAYVDGHDTLNVGGTQLWFEHDYFLLPGNPIYVNGVPWSPRWNKNTSTRFMGLIPAFNPRNATKIKQTAFGQILPNTKARPNLFCQFRGQKMSWVLSLVGQSSY